MHRGRKEEEAMERKKRGEQIEEEGARRIGIVKEEAMEGEEIREGDARRKKRDPWMLTNRRLQLEIPDTKICHYVSSPNPVAEKCKWTKRKNERLPCLPAEQRFRPNVMKSKVKRRKNEG